GGHGPGRGDEDRRRLIGETVYPRAIDGVELALEVSFVTLPEVADDIDGFRQHAQPRWRCGPGVAEDVFVEVLAGAHPEEEPAGRHRPDGRCCLGDDRGMDADHRTRDRRPDRQPLRGMCDSAEDGPDERTLAL